MSVRSKLKAPRIMPSVVMADMQGVMWHTFCSLSGVSHELHMECRVNQSDLERYLEIIKKFDAAMLVTRRGPELRARPMSIAKCSEQGRLSFLTSIESGKLDEITDEPFVNLAMQGNSQFMSVSGTAMVSRERRKVDELWSPTYSIWFPDGKDDPTVTVLEVVPTYAEYWDNSGAEGVRSLLEIGKSVVTGDAPELDDEVHQKIDFPKSSRESG